MSKKAKKRTHPKGEQKNELLKINKLAENVGLAVDTFKGKVHIEWDPQAAVTPLGQLAFFIEFLKQGNLFEPWVNDCPLEFVSPNAPRKRDILGTFLLSILAGHWRYAHITALRADGVNPDLLGMTKVVSEDCSRRSFSKIDEDRGIAWKHKHLHRCYDPLLSMPWILDVDTIVKPLYGKQEGAVLGYNPKKPGRPSHTYHAYTLANLRLVLDVEVQPGNQMASCYSAPDLWKFLERILRECWPKFIRRDCGFGTDGVMRAAEERSMHYLFKLKSSKQVKDLVARASMNDAWSYADYSFQAQEAAVKLQGWKQYRRGNFA